MSDNKKKGDLLNQLAIISDLIEKANIETINSSIVLDLNHEEYEKTIKYLQEKTGGNITYKANKSIGIIIGNIRILFNEEVNKNNA